MLLRHLGPLAACTLVAPPAPAQVLSSELVASGLDKPIHALTRPGETSPLFVLEQATARVLIFQDGEALPRPFLDLGAVAGSGFERGLLSMAFHPDYHANGRFFVNYVGNDGDSVVAEYAVSEFPETALPDPVQTILVVPQPDPIHNVAHLVFGPDGMLYVGTGDGGPGWDPNNVAQDGSSNLGKLLRLDVDLPPPFIPADNPFVGDESVNDEIWALGLRNPWRFSFDRVTGDLWLADVGQNQREEIDFLPAGHPGGANFGWRCEEGTVCTGMGGCACGDSTLVRPIHEYHHQAGRCAIIGGHVYRGRRAAEMRGRYFFADWCAGRVWSLVRDGNGITDLVDHTADLAPENGFWDIHSIGTDAAGELYIVDGERGEVYRVGPGCGHARFCSAEVNSTGGAAAMDASGSTSVGTKDLTLLVTSAVPGEPGVFFYGQGVQDAPFGDGRLCVGSKDQLLFRLHPAITVDRGGGASLLLDYDSRPGGEGLGLIEPGDTWHFQFWYRDPVGPGGSGFNLSDALRVTFCP